MADFKQAIEFVLSNEDPTGQGIVTTDAGGVTKYGISQAAYPHLDIANLTRDEAISIYERDYWIFGGLISQRLATKLLDVYVNEEHIGIKLLQAAISWFPPYSELQADGVFGAITLARANALPEDRLIDELKFRLIDHYRKNADPAKLDGLLRRAVKG